MPVTPVVTSLLSKNKMVNYDVMHRYLTFEHDIRAWPLTSAHTDWLIVHCVTGLWRWSQTMQTASVDHWNCTLYNLVVSFLLTAGHDTNGCRINTMLQLDEGKKFFFFSSIQNKFSNTTFSGGFW